MSKNTQDKKTSEVGYIKPREITAEMADSYIDYAMSVIISRALPDVRDGLKPVQRRILFAMLEEGLRHDAKFRKSATVVGATLGRYHPHGDVPVYEAMVRMAQDFSLRYPLVKGQGNFGSIDSDPPAASRYTEAKLSKIGEEMLKDIEKETVDFTPNYDGTRKEPVVLPSPLPQLLLNGTIGIAVGMATNIPPHNLLEVCQALIYLLDHPKAETAELLKFIKGPDFPTGGIVYDGREIASAYSQGKGSILMRGKAEVVEGERGKKQIIVSEIPFQVSKANLLEKFAKLVEQKQVDGVKDIRDESDREGMRIVIELSRTAFPQKVLNRLYKFTDLQKFFHLNMIALIDGLQPRVLNLADVLKYFLVHRKEVVKRRAEFELKRAKERAHILEGLQKCLSEIDAVIKTIKQSKDRETASENLIKKFGLTLVQARAVLEIKLQQLARLERQRIEEELKEKKRQIRELEALLKSPEKIKELIKKELKEIAEVYGDKRKTRVIRGRASEISEEDLVPLEETVIILTRKGFIKRVKPSSYKAQKRGGKGILGAKIGEDDIISRFLLAQTHDLLLFFTDSGKVFQVPAYEIPEGTRLSRGKNIANFLEVSSDEKILDILPRRKKEEEAKYLLMATRAGLVKKTAIEEFENVRKTGLIAIRLKKGDLLKKVVKTSGEDSIILINRKGKAIVFKEKDLRPMSRIAAGNIGMRLNKDDAVIGMAAVTRLTTSPEVRPQEKSGAAPRKLQLLVVSERGFGKRTALSQYRVQKRGGRGLIAAKLNNKTGDLAAAKILTGEEEHLIIISQKGHVIKTSLNSVRSLSRTAQGVKLINLARGDKVASVICV